MRVHTGDARELALPEAAYDRVLVDAPCTGLGALRRRPEARWRRQPDDVAELTALQRELLRAGLERTRPGGVVTYATCSPHPDETAAVVAAVAAETGAEVLDTPALLPGGAGHGAAGRRAGRPAVAAPPRHRRDVRRGPAQAVNPVLDWWLADRTRGGPGSAPWVVGQWPNPALVVFLLALVARLVVPDPATAEALVLVGRGALLVWGLDELVRGVNPFRRVLGLGVSGWQVVGLLTA